MVEDLVRIFLGNESSSLISDVKKISPGLAATIQRIAYNAINESGKLAVSAYRSASPIDTGELKDQIITLASPSQSAANPQATVFIAQVQHIGRDRKPLDASLLVDILNIGKGPRGPLKRSQPSHAENGFPVYSGFTKDWLNKAENNLEKRLPALLRKNFNY